MTATLTYIWNDKPINFGSDCETALLMMSPTTRLEYSLLTECLQPHRIDKLFSVCYYYFYVFNFLNSNHKILTIFVCAVHVLLKQSLNGFSLLCSLALSFSPRRNMPNDFVCSTQKWVWSAENTTFDRFEVQFHRILMILWQKAQLMLFVCAFKPNSLRCGSVSWNNNNLLI